MAAALLQYPGSTSAVDPETFVAERVLAELGKPRNFHRVVVKPLWGSHYRVNVYTRTDTGERLPRVMVTDSFFVTLTDDGIVTRPSIERKYK